VILSALITCGLKSYKEERALRETQISQACLKWCPFKTATNQSKYATLCAVKRETASNCMSNNLSVTLSSTSSFPLLSNHFLPSFILIVCPLNVSQDCCLSAQHITKASKRQLKLIRFPLVRMMRERYIMKEILKKKNTVLTPSQVSGQVAIWCALIFITIVASCKMFHGFVPI